MSFYYCRGKIATWTVRPHHAGVAYFADDDRQLSGLFALDTASKNLAALKEAQTDDSSQGAATTKLEGETKKKYDLIYSFDPDLRNYASVEQANKQP